MQSNDPNICSVMLIALTVTSLLHTVLRSNRPLLSGKLNTFIRFAPTFQQSSVEIPSEVRVRLQGLKRSRTFGALLLLFAITGALIPFFPFIFFSHYLSHRLEFKCKSTCKLSWVFSCHWPLTWSHDQSRPVSLLWSLNQCAMHTVHWFLHVTPPVNCCHYH